MSKLHQKKYFYLLASLMVTILFLSPNLLNDFLNWDDSAYVLQNDLIKDLSLNGIKNIFTTPEVVSTYVPLTLLSWMIDYAISGLNPVIFHTTNLLLHLLVVGVVFYFTKLLSKNKIVALITAILFGIHPMHVEVVGWISARKDLLYALFFLGSLLVYYFYAERETKYPKCYYYIACLLFYILSLLSKGAAVTLPLVLFLFDYLKARKFNLKLILEKLPFILLSVFFVMSSINMQEKGGAMDDRQFISVIDSFSVGFYGYLTYLIKCIVPFNLSAYHPYPNQLGESNPWFYYASAIPILILGLWLITKLKKNRSLVFGFGFFFISLIPVIQVLPFGTAVTADRYTYLPYFGLLYLVGIGAVWLYDKHKKNQKTIVIGLPVYMIVLGVITYQYSKTFENGETLWTNVIKQYPNDFLGYMNRAEYRISKKEYENAIVDLDKAIKINPNFHSLHYYRSFAFHGLGNKDKSIKDLTHTLKLMPSFAPAYLNRGKLHGELGKEDMAIADFTKNIQVGTDKFEGYYNRALYYKKIKEYDKALNDMENVIAINNLYAPAYYFRGELYLSLNDINNAFKSFTKALELDPKMAVGYTKLGNLWLDKNNFEEALIKYNKAVLLDASQIDAYINKGIIYMNLKEYNKAHLNFDLAKKTAPKNHIVYFNKGLLYQLMNDNKRALKEIEQCIALKPNFEPAILKKNELLNQSINSE